MARTRALICPYCGETQPESVQCRACQVQFDAGARRERHNAMGPWFVRDEAHPFLPGCSYEEIVRRVEQGTVTKHTLMRGPTTRQLWTIAKRIPGIAHLLGFATSAALMSIRAIMAAMPAAPDSEHCSIETSSACPKSKASTNGPVTPTLISSSTTHPRRHDHCTTNRR